MALRSTKKEVIARIKAYITENTEPELMEAIAWEEAHHTGEITEAVQSLYKAGKVYEACALYIMENWKARKNPHCPTNYQANFIDWLNTLPLNIADYIVRQPDSKTLLANWLEQTEAEQDRFTDEEADTHTGYLIYREVSKTATKNGFRY